MECAAHLNVRNKHCASAGREKSFTFVFINISLYLLFLNNWNTPRVFYFESQSRRLIELIKRWAYKRNLIESLLKKVNYNWINKINKMTVWGDMKASRSASAFPLFFSFLPSLLLSFFQPIITSSPPSNPLFTEIPVKWFQPSPLLLFSPPPSSLRSSSLPLLPDLSSSLNYSLFFLPTVLLLVGTCQSSCTVNFRASSIKQRLRSCGCSFFHCCLHNPCRIIVS